YQLSNKLRYHGWQVPAYTLPAKAEEVAILRVVVKEGFDYDLATLLVEHIRQAIKELKEETQKPSPSISSTKIC
ncbi:MAG: glutamate decarboxylase, partial [Campylobacterota bacterium]|nr:glutamate decarboxylase [Campylobacterota bacterium]